MDDSGVALYFKKPSCGECSFFVGKIMILMQTYYEILISFPSKDLDGVSLLDI